MKPIELLKEEHRLILRILDALETFAASLEREEEGEREELGRFATFIREYADACHHGKEEAVLFEVMAQSGFSKDSGPIAVMLHEHDVGRACVRVMREGADEKGPWSAEARSEIVTAARAYVQLLRDHIHKEDEILYPMAEAHLPGGAMEEVVKGCGAVEEEYERSGEKTKLEALAEELIERHATRPE